MIPIGVVIISCHLYALAVDALHSGKLDACGVCNGTGVVVDIEGNCCSQPLVRMTAAVMCCPSIFTSGNLTSGTHVDANVCRPPRDCAVTLTLMTVACVAGPISACTPALYSSGPRTPLRS